MILEELSGVLSLVAMYILYKNYGGFCIWFIYGMIAVLIGAILLIIGLRRAEKLQLKRSKWIIAGAIIFAMGAAYNSGLIVLAIVTIVTGIK